MRDEQAAPLAEDAGGGLLHPWRQALERYGISIQPGDLVDVIESGAAKLIGYGVPGTGRLIYSVLVRVDGEFVWVKSVYAPPDETQQRGVIVTILPPKFHREITREKNSAQQKQDARRKKQFARELRQANAEDDNDFNS